MIRVLSAAWAAVALLAGGAGCQGRARTAEESYLRLERSIAAGDAIGFYGGLDRAARDAVKSVFNDQRLMRTIITAKYPEAAARPELARLQAAAEPDAERYFAAVARGQRLVEGYRKRLGSVSGPTALRADGPDGAWVARQDGMPFHFHRDADGSWGFSELDAEWLLERDRASHAVQTVRDNARLYGATE